MESVLIARASAIGGRKEIVAARTPGLAAPSAAAVRAAKRNLRSILGLSDSGNRSRDSMAAFRDSRRRSKSKSPHGNRRRDARTRLKRNPAKGRRRATVNESAGEGTSPSSLTSRFRFSSQRAAVGPYSSRQQVRDRTETEIGRRRRPIAMLRCPKLQLIRQKASPVPGGDQIHAGLRLESQAATPDSRKMMKMRTCEHTQ